MLTPVCLSNNHLRSNTLKVILSTTKNIKVSYKFSFQTNIEKNPKKIEKKKLCETND